MIGFGHHQRFFIYTLSADMRKGYNGLAGIVRNELNNDPLSGDVYVFFGKNRQIVKMLCWDKDGFALYSKRLERGVFENLQGVIQSPSQEIAYQHLVMLMSGISLVGLRQKTRYLLTKKVV
ncbi:MAG: IS66 family insertion sequence element accessory protein TnpB [Saprospiraceae bacterium]